MNIAQETPATKKLYGLDRPTTYDFGVRCLLARRMLESGVRFVQLYSGDTGGWDAHNNVQTNHTEYCEKTDRPIAGLLADLIAARPAGRHARHLGRRIRPHADERTRQRARP